MAETVGIEVQTEKAKALVEKALRNPENDFAGILRLFQEAGEPVWHIDRHVLDSEEAIADGFDFRLSACEAGLYLLRQWSDQRSAEHGSGLVISEPYLVIDDAWLEGGPHAPPPHVYVCISNGELGLATEHEPDSGSRLRMPAALVQLLADDEIFYRASGAFEDEPGAWIIKIRTVHAP